MLNECENKTITKNNNNNNLNKMFTYLSERISQRAAVYTGFGCATKVIENAIQLLLMHFWMTFSTLFRSYVYIYGSFSTLLYYLIMQTNCEEWKQREIERGGGDLREEREWNHRPHHNSVVYELFIPTTVQLNGYPFQRTWVGIAFKLSVQIDSCPFCFCTCKIF